MTSEVVPTPRLGSEVTGEWVQHILTCYEKRSDPQAAVKVINYNVRAGTKPGENVASEIIKIWAEVELTGRSKEEKEEKEREKEVNNTSHSNASSSTSTSTTTTTTTSKKEYNLVAKFNMGSEFDREYVKQTQMDLNELLIYSDIIPQINTWQEQVLREKGEEGEALERFRVSVPEYIYGICNDTDYALVMQDVSVLGYTTEDKMQGLDLPHLLMAADRLARLHALSHAFDKTHDFNKHYPSFKFKEKLFEFFIDFALVITDAVVEMASQRPDFAPIVEKMRGNRESLKERLLAAITPDNPNHRVMCLAHGDYWTNNLMYSHEGTAANGDAKTPQDLMLIDWGLVAWRNPMCDLHLLVYNCTTASLRRQHLQEVLHRYHSAFTAATTALGAPVAGYNMEEFLKEWRRMAIVGFLQGGLFANAIVLSHTAAGAFKKGSPSSGFKSKALTMVSKVMIPLLLKGWFISYAVEANKKAFQPLFEELMSGENHVMNSRLLDVLEEAYQAGVIDW